MEYKKYVVAVIVALSTGALFGMRYQIELNTCTPYQDAVREADEFMVQHLDAFDNYKQECELAEQRLQDLDFKKVTPQEKFEKEAQNAYALYKHLTLTEMFHKHNYWHSIMSEDQHKELWNSLWVATLNNALDEIKKEELKLAKEELKRAEAELKRAEEELKCVDEELKCVAKKLDSAHVKYALCLFNISNEKLESMFK